ncbi:MAG: phosphoribosylamine--glycine ligase [Patescibacteria group bacterium]|nr:phosphoribosylamine--glycine ligase [Patescibacteria group bacterium]
MNVLILGGSAREHALAWKIKQSPLAKEIFVAPGNAGTATVGKNLAINPSDHPALITACRENGIELVIVSSDSYLAEGAVDALTDVGILAFGPTKAAAEIEWSKAFAKQLMKEEGIPTARSEQFENFDAATAYVKTQSLPIVIKASGLAAGKGVVIAQTQEEAIEALKDMMINHAFGTSGECVVIEEFLEGKEISIHALCVDENAILFPIAQDHKRAFDDDRGPNTGGMGTIAPVPGVSDAQMHEIKDRVVLAVLRGLKKRGRPFRGLLYPSVMLTVSGPKVIEYNTRFGDPETESYMRLLESDLLPVLALVAKGSLKDVQLKWSTGAACCIVVASGGYPARYEIGFPILGIESAEVDDVVIFHFGTSLKEGAVVTNGGRILGITAIGSDLQHALAGAYAAVKKISFPKAYYRADIGTRAFT